MSRRRLLLVTLAVGLVMPASAVAAPGVGHRVEHIKVPGAALGELRNVDVHLWYPAQVAGQPKTVYTSALFGKPLPNGWAPLSWSVEAELAARGRTPRRGGPYAPIVFSHGAHQRPDRLRAHAGGDRGRRVRGDRARTHEQHPGRRAARLPQRARRHAGVRLRGRVGARPLPTLNANGFPSADCAKGNVPNSMSDRVRDVDAVLDAFPAGSAAPLPPIRRA